MMHPTKCVRRCSVCLLGILSAIPIDVSGAVEPGVGVWSGGAAVGFLGNTTDGTAFAANFHDDYFTNRQFSLGPLGRLAPHSLDCSSTPREHASPSRNATAQFRDELS